MLRCTSADRGAAVKVTFALPMTDADQPVSVLGDFNGWDAEAHPMKKRSNGTRSATVEVPAGATLRFKYLAADGTWFCDPDAGTVPSPFDTMDSLVTV